MFSIDGIEWDVYCEISRISEMQSSEISGLLLDKSYFNDVLGTYLKYDVSIVVPYDKRTEYYELYETVTEPVGSHTFVFPYGSDYVTVSGRVESISDIYEKMPDGTSYWRGIKFTVLSSYPTKTMTLSEVQTAGMSPFPSTVQLEINSLWEYTAEGWVESSAFENYDEVYF